MIDLETLGSRSNSAICSIGAVPFNLDGTTGSAFYVKIKLASCLEAKLRVDADTIEWWSRQNPDAFKEMLSGRSTLFYALHTLALLIAQMPEDVQLWGNGSRFDLGLLTDAYNAISLPIPWNFGNERDVRTIVSLNPSIKASIPKPKQAHYPIADCLYQIEYLTKTLQSIGHGINSNEPDCYFQLPVGKVG